MLTHADAAETPHLVERYTSTRVVFPNCVWDAACECYCQCQIVTSEHDENSIHTCGSRAACQCTLLCFTCKVSMLSLERRGTKKRTLLPVNSDVLPSDRLVNHLCCQNYMYLIQRLRQLKESETGQAFAPNLAAASSCDNYRWINCMSTSP